MFWFALFHTGIGKSAKEEKAYLIFVLLLYALCYAFGQSEYGKKKAPSGECQEPVQDGRI